MQSLSIIIPIYKVEKYIGRCLETVILQENANTSIECILVNDCTPDNSMDIISQKLKNYNGKINFVIKNLPMNSGISVARNEGLAIAKGEYLMFIDSDDRLQSDAITYFIEGLTKMASDKSMDVVLGNTFICKNHEAAMSFDNNNPFVIDNSEGEGLRRLMKRELYHTAWNKLIRRDFLMEYHLLFENGIIDEDLLWSYQVFLHARYILVMPKVTYIYEDNPGSIVNTTSQKLALTINSRIITCKKILSSPPSVKYIDYYMYVFFVLTRAINLYESNSSSLSYLKDDLYALRDGFLREVRQSGYYLAYLFFLTSVTPFYYITNFRLFRRYYDRIVKFVVFFSKKR